MHKILTNYFTFVIACLAVIIAFMTATTYVQLAVAILLYPVLVYFAFRLFPRRRNNYASEINAIHHPEQEPEPEPVEKAEATNISSLGISDIDKRVFLKLIGGAGIALFLFSIFNKKAEGLFFKNLPPPSRVSVEGIDGNKIDPSQNHPTDGYRISEMDDNVLTFYGFTNKDGAWFIMKQDTDTGSFRYSKGESNFPGSWNNRERLRYDYYHNIFP